MKTNASRTGRAYAAASAVLLWHLLGQGYPTIADVAAELAVSKPTARRWLDLAEAHGIAARARKQRGTLFTYVYFPAGEMATRHREISERSGVRLVR